ncbi:hypothetical protein [Aridibaculum aurantiacum]|uniref:hypothetical protein n=1 Tax=Aridibaculum aurantiacum TaxID=2810307 RepID=UPI001A96BB1E|nr:hypothetical protein [Aridibaculum aurantiacum]
MQKTVPFSFNKDVGKDHFFNQLLPAAQKLYPDQDIQKLESVRMYAAVLKEAYIEKDYVLEWNEMNDSSRKEKVTYHKVDGYATRLYLGLVTTSPSNINAAVFFTAKFNPDRECLGFGPAYFGVVNPSLQSIRFTTDLAVKQPAGNFQLVVQGKQTRPGGVLFVSPDFLKPAFGNITSIKVEKIVFLDPNKIGGYKPVVFPVKEVMQDEHALLFRYLTTIQL